jgi:hypothetical protein
MTFNISISFGTENKKNAGAMEEIYKEYDLALKSYTDLL